VPLLSVLKTNRNAHGLTSTSNWEILHLYYAEVWGVEASTGAAKAACWLGGLVTLSSQKTGSVVSLELDKRWLQLAGVHGPLTLKNVYVSDIDTSFPVARSFADILVANSDITIDIRPEMANMQITEEMRFGVNPLPRRNSTSSSAADTSLFLLPGYCASKNPWSQHSGDFHGAQYFVEKGNWGHAEYALKAMAFIEKYISDSFSFIGHSQGGFVALHILNYYFTALDSASGGRTIQTVGTPWLGCSAAGDAAALGAVFGVGCGANNDLTRDGATNWLTGINLEARKLVHSYTTTYKLGNFFGDWCNLPMNIILQWPNDGTTELAYAKLPGGVDQGNTEKQCHTEGMAYSCQTNDNGRNKQMNNLAAR